MAFVTLVPFCTVLPAAQEAQTAGDAAKTPQMPDPETRTPHAPCVPTGQEATALSPEWKLLAGQPGCDMPPLSGVQDVDGAQRTQGSCGWGRFPSPHTLDSPPGLHPTHSREPQEPGSLTHKISA